MNKFETFAELVRQQLGLEIFDSEAEHLELNGRHYRNVVYVIVGQQKIGFTTFSKIVGARYDEFPQILEQLRVTLGNLSA